MKRIFVSNSKDVAWQARRCSGMNECSPGTKCRYMLMIKTQLKYCACVINVLSLYISKTGMKQYYVLFLRHLTFAQFMHIFHWLRCIWICMSLAKSPNARRLFKTYVYAKTIVILCYCSKCS